MYSLYIYIKLVNTPCVSMLYDVCDIDAYDFWWLTVIPSRSYDTNNIYVSIYMRQPSTLYIYSTIYVSK